ncbi:MAG: ion transporter, partial [Chloroflexota bacterium]
LRLLRVFRVYRVIRLLRQHGTREVVGDLSARRASATFYLTIFLVIVVVEFAAIGVLAVEHGVAGANIRNAGDALWWGLVTITTVGYGDAYPVTGAGRIVGVFLLFAGIALFSVLTGFIANIFLAPRTDSRPPAEPGTVAAEMGVLRAMLDEQDQRTAAMRARLAGLEQRLPKE